MSAPWLLVVDVETSGLHVGSNFLLEVGFRVVDRDLASLAERGWVLGYDSRSLDRIRAEAPPEVQKMHVDSGLWEECDAGVGRGARWLAAHELQMAAPALLPLAGDMVTWLMEHEAGGLPVAGSTVRFDRGWLDAWLPGFEGFGHHRSVDVSSLKVLVEEWRPDLLADRPVGRKLHRVLPDMEDTVGELAYYRDRLGFLPAVGPAS